jgi:hypothetical protein
MLLLHFIREIIGKHPSDGTSDDEITTKLKEMARMNFVAPLLDD